jgi:hypothetical protein
MTKDARLEQFEATTDLRGADLVRKTYRAYRPGWDHDHCAGCFAKFAEFDIPGERVEHEGYATTSAYPRGADYEWVCVSCFGLFRDEMGWREIREPA